MLAKFDALCTKLGINSSSPAPQDLEKLINWCETTISTDRHFEGDFKKRFTSYQNFAADFLENVEPNIQTDKLMEPVAAFKKMTSLVYIVNKGLDVYLKKLAPGAEQINTKVQDSILLQWAAALGHLHTTEALLELGANPQEKITSGDSLLFNALILPVFHNEKMKQNKQLIYALLSQYSKNIVDERNSMGDTILHMMSTYGYSELVDKALRTQLKELVSIPNNLGHYPIHSAILNGQRECIQLLIAVDNVKDLTDAKGRNALHYAAQYGNEEMVKIALNSTISKDAVDKQKQTPLILAAIAHKALVVKTLLDAGVQINIRDNSKRSALHYAVESNDLNVVRLLLASADIEVNISDDASHNPIDLIQAHTTAGDVISELLIAKGAVCRTQYSKG